MIDMSLSIKKVNNRLLVLKPLDKSRSAWFNVTECPLDYSYHKKFINKAQHQAGIKFRYTYERTSKLPKTNYDGNMVDYGYDKSSITEKQVEALQELSHIKENIGEYNYQLAVRYCAEAYSIKYLAGNLNRSRNTLARSVKLMLFDLAKYYGL